MEYSEGYAGYVHLVLSSHEAEQLEKFIHLSAMSLQTWPIVAGDYMTQRKAANERRSKSSDPPTP